MKIIHIVDSGGVYGIEKMLISLLPELEKGGSEVILMSLNANTASSPEMKALSSQGVKHIWPDNLNKMGSLYAIFYICGKLLSLKPDMIHVHGYKATILAGGISLLFRIPCFATYHAENKYVNKVSKYAVIETKILQKIAGIVAVSSPIKKELEERGIKKERIKVIQNGISDNFLKIENDILCKNRKKQKTVLFAGRLVEIKNLHVLINAFAGLKKKYPEAELIVAGDGPNKNELVDQVDSLRITDSVNFLGYVDDMHSLYRRCDCFVLPSQTEGMPITIIEAMSFALPIVASSVGEIPKLIENEKEGLLVEPNDEAQLLSQLKKIFAADSFKKELGQNARRKYIQKYTASIMAENYASFYETIYKSL